MHHSNEPNQSVGQIVRYALRHPVRWLLPTIVIGGLSFGYALVHQPDWIASQALTVREDYSESSEWAGQFNEAEQLKHAQETFLELAKSPSVTSVALETLGPPASYPAAEEWPTRTDIAAAREKIEVLAPNGMEYGTTRMFYLNVADPDPERAIQLAGAICDESEKRFKQLRDQEMRDAITELTNRVELAAEELDKETTKLQEMEVNAGSDLSELRMLSESFAGGSNLQTTLAEVRQELRQAESTSSANEQLLNQLTAAQEDPANLVATPNRLLESQPALRRLKEGLIDAQINSSQLLGTMSSEHPRVKAAQVAETEIRGHLHRELEVAVRGLRGEQALFQVQIGTLTTKMSDLRQRLQKLAAMRASYSNQLAEVRQQTTALTSAQQDLNATRASLAAGDVVALVTRVDEPQTGPYPQGPGRSVIAAAGCAGGLLFGLGVVMLTLPTTVLPTTVLPTTALSTTATSQPAATPVPVNTNAGNTNAGNTNQASDGHTSSNQTNVTQGSSHQPSAAPNPSIVAAPASLPAPSPAPSPALSPASAFDTSRASTTTADGRTMTLKEALVRCSTKTGSWK